MSDELNELLGNFLLKDSIDEVALELRGYNVHTSHFQTAHFKTNCVRGSTFFSLPYEAGMQVITHVSKKSLVRCYQRYARQVTHK